MVYVNCIFFSSIKRPLKSEKKIKLITLMLGHTMLFYWKYITNIDCIRKSNLRAFMVSYFFMWLFLFLAWWIIIETLLLCTFFWINVNYITIRHVIIQFPHFFSMFKLLWIVYWYIVPEIIPFHLVMLQL